MVKSKVRFDGLDVAAMVAHWNRVALGRRVINIYNGSNGDTYLMKLDKQTGEAGNMLLLLESGIRFHSTNESYENPGMPSPFCAKLRKHLRGLRLESVQQLGKKDRVVLLTFGSGEAQRHALILEFYARGNIVLTNSSYSILSLLRSHDYDGQIKVQVGHTYPVTYATTMGSLDDGVSNESVSLLTTPSPLDWYKANCSSPEDTAKNPTSTTGKKTKGNAEANSEWRSLLLRAESGVAHYTPTLLEHCLLCAEIDPKQQPPSTLNEDDWKRLQISLLKEGERIFAETEVVDGKGYILYQTKPTSTDQQNEEQNPATSLYGDKLFLEFQPYLLKQHQHMLRLEFDSFNHAVDAFFAHIESQKRVLRAETQQAQAEQRLDKIKKDQEQRVEQLRKQQETLKIQAQLVETHADMVDKAIQVVNSALDTGMDWDQLEDLVRVEQTQNRNPVALLIDRLDLEHDALVLRLEKLDFMIEDTDSDEDPSSSKFMNVTVDLNDTAFGNASTMFAKYRASKDKGQKTIEASTKALEAAEESAKRQVLEAQKRKTHVTGTLQIKRKPLWFEKFNWFITSDNYLVIAGRDAQQNEVIVKRYLRPGDAYLHADVHGAASCILRAKRRRTTLDGKTQTLPLSEQALREAGSFTICQSSAWKSRMVTSAWWVEAHQVSKTAPTGEYLTVGSFMVRGKKNYLPPTQLEMGFAVLFRLGDDEGIARHKNERRDFALMQLEQQEEESVLETDPAPASANEPMDLSPIEAEVDESTPDEQPPLNDDSFAAPAISSEETNQDDSPGEEETDRFLTTDEALSATSSDKAATKKGLSIKQRRLIKKYGSLEAAQAAEDARLKAEQSNSAKSKESGPCGKNGTDPPKRGKRTKLQKMAKKYAEQDEEDRELALMALHAGEKDKKKEKKTGPELSEAAKNIAAQTIQILNKDPAEIAGQLPAAVKEILGKTVSVPVSTESTGPPEIRWGKFDADVLEQLLALESEEQQLAAAQRLLTLKESTRIDNFSASLAGIIRTIRKYGHEGLQTATPGNSTDAAAAKRKTKAEKENEQESWKRTLAEEGVVDEELDDDAVDDTVELGKLTGKPHPDDLILFAVPVCAPYPTLSQYTYRVKLTPGNMKRGKAVKACIEMFLKDEQKSPQSTRLKELIKKVAETEWVHAVIGDVKIAAAGAQKQIQKSKNKPKKK